MYTWIKKEDCTSTCGSMTKRSWIGCKWNIISLCLEIFFLLACMAKFACLTKTYDNAYVFALIYNCCSTIRQIIIILEIVRIFYLIFWYICLQVWIYKYDSHGREDVHQLWPCRRNMSQALVRFETHNETVHK